MKAKRVLISIILTSSMGIAQTTIPNGGFESWTITAGNEIPDNWKPRTDSFGNISALKSADMHNGIFAARIYNNIDPADTLHGVLTSAKPGDDTEGAYPVFPVTQRHESLNYFYKFNADGGDSAEVTIVMFKTGYSGPFGPGICGYGISLHGSAASYTAGTVDIIYFDGVVIPDSAWIAIAAFKEIDPVTFTNYEPLGNSELTIDQLTFDGFSALTDMAGYGEIEVYPNPCSDKINFQAEALATEVSVCIYNLQGELINRCIIQSNEAHQFSLAIDEVPEGQYHLLISTEEEYWVKRIQVIH